MMMMMMMIIKHTVILMLNFLTLDILMSEVRNLLSVVDSSA